MTTSIARTPRMQHVHTLLTKLLLISFFFFFNDTATTEIYTLSLHDALPIWSIVASLEGFANRGTSMQRPPRGQAAEPDRKSTRLNSSHVEISYAVFCLKKKKKKKRTRLPRNRYTAYKDITSTSYYHLPIEYI